MATNHSDKYLSLGAAGNVIVHDEAGHPDARSVLAVPGGSVPGDAVARYGLDKYLAATDPDAVQFDGAGNAIVVEDGRARAAAALPTDDPRRAKLLAAEADRRKANAERPPVLVETGTTTRNLADHPATGAEKVSKPGVVVQHEDTSKPVTAGLVTAPVAGKPVVGVVDGGKKGA